MRVLIAEDSALLRGGLSALLRSADFEIVGEVETADDLIAAVDSTSPDVVITDIKMPPGFDQEGLEAAEAIKEKSPEIGVLVLSQYVEVGYARKLLSTPGVGYLLKDRVRDIDQFVTAVRLIAAGEIVIDKDLVERLLQKKRVQDPLSSLTPREREILQLMAQGRSNAGLCEDLFLSPKTVETHVGSIFMKLSLSATPADHRRVLAVLDYLRAN